MIRSLTLFAMLSVAACSGAPSHELVQTDKNDPTWPLNPGKWTYQDNALITPPLTEADHKPSFERGQRP